MSDHHDHDHAPITTKADTPSTYYQRMETVVRELLIEKGVLDADQVRATIELMDTRTPANGARLVARAWVDTAFRRLLLDDPRAALEALDLAPDPSRMPSELMVVENTPDVHNLVVCTLCSCYPRFLLGLPPDWYKSATYRARAVREPRAVLAEFGTVLPEAMTVRVHDSTADLRYLVLPMRPAGTEGLSEAALANLVTRDSLIGVTLPRAP